MTLAILELTTIDGGEVYESDIRVDNLQNLYWVTAEGIRIKVPDLAESHLRNIALMLMGFGYAEFHKPERLKILWLTALRMEWERRRPNLNRTNPFRYKLENGKLLENKR